MKNRNLLILIGMIAVIIVGALLLRPLFSNTRGAPAGGVSVQETTLELTIACVGDVMVHEPQIRAQFDNGTSIYNFDNNFQYIKKYIEEADLAICNLETTFGGPPYTGYPSFSSPDELAQGLKNAGFDVAATANNHMLDKGLVGLKRTLDVLWANGFATTGSTMEAGKPRYALQEVKGVPVAVISYTYQTPSIDSRVAINGSYISNETAAHINSFGYEDLDTELAKIKDVVTEARDAGAQLVVMFYHWGNEYHLKANQYQRYMAEQTVQNMDVDVIFGSHSHNLQEMEYYTKTTQITDEDGNPLLDEETGQPAVETKQVPVFFGLGNFISNQRVETVDNRYTEVGAIGRVTFTFSQQEKDGEILSRELASAVMDAVPTWVDKYKLNGKDVYVVVPLDEELQNNGTLAVSGHLSRAQSALEDANGVLGIN